MRFHGPLEVIEGKVDRVTANHSLSSTASQGTSNIPIPCFLVLGCNRQALVIFILREVAWRKVYYNIMSLYPWRSLAWPQLLLALDFFEAKLINSSYRQGNSYIISCISSLDQNSLYYKSSVYSWSKDRNSSQLLECLFSVC